MAVVRAVLGVMAKLRRGWLTGILMSLTVVPLLLVYIKSTGTPQHNTQLLTQIVMWSGKSTNNKWNTGSEKSANNQQDMWSETLAPANYTPQFDHEFMNAVNTSLLCRASKSRTLVYNRLSKASSTTIREVMKGLRRHNNMTFFDHDTSNIRHLNFDKRKKLAVNILNRSEPYIFARQLYFINFEPLGFTTPPYMNTIRHPVDRWYSSFYWMRSLSPHAHTRSRQDRMLTVEQCFATNHRYVGDSLVGR